MIDGSALLLRILYPDNVHNTMLLLILSEEKNIDILTVFVQVLCEMCEEEVQSGKRDREKSNNKEIHIKRLRRRIGESEEEKCQKKMKNKKINIR